MKDGYIEITDNKVNFVYHELGKPGKSPGLDGSFSEDINYIKSVEKYIASKRTVEVSNVIFGKLSKTWIIKNDLYDFRGREVKNNQSCKAEVNGTATIIELL